MAVDEAEVSGEGPDTVRGPARARVCAQAPGGWRQPGLWLVGRLWAYYPGPFRSQTSKGNRALRAATAVWRGGDCFPYDLVRRPGEGTCVCQRRDHESRLQPGIPAYLGD